MCVPSNNLDQAVCITFPKFLTGMFLSHPSITTLNYLERLIKLVNGNDGDISVTTQHRTLFHKDAKNMYPFHKYEKNDLLYLCNCFSVHYVSKLMKQLL